MKIVILISTLVFSLTAAAEATWFAPGCENGICKGMLQPGQARLGNNRGVLNTRSRKSVKPVTSPGAAPASTAPVSK